MRTNEEILIATPWYAIGTRAALSNTEYGPEFTQMFGAGLIGENGGLTRKGSILAERLQNAQLDELFG